MKNKKLLQKILAATSNVRFKDMTNCAELFGFKLDRTKGSHHIFVHKDISELLNLQNINGKAKPYQIKQFLNLIEKHNLKMSEDDE